MRTKQNISPEQRSVFSMLMNRRLAAAIDLQEQLKEAHQKIKGFDFPDLHELFGRISAALEAYVDSIAKHLEELGCISGAALRTVPTHSPLKESPPPVHDNENNVDAAIKTVAKSFETFVQEIGRFNHEMGKAFDSGAGKILADMSQGMDKWLSFVKTNIQPKH